MTYPLQPLEGNIIVAPAKVEEHVTESGLILAGTVHTGVETITSATESTGPLKATIVAVGPGRVDGGVRCEMDVAVGDEVLYVQGNETKLDSGDLVMPEGHVVAKLVDGEIVPYWDKVLVRWDSNEEVRASGIVLQQREVGYEEGEVLTVGPGYVKRGFREPLGISVGDRILFNQYMGVEVEHELEDTRRLFLIREYDVYGVLTA